MNPDPSALLASFPDTSHLREGVYVPILFCPRIAAPERFGIGVVAICGEDWFLCEAEGLDRLVALFGAEGEIVEIALARSFRALRDHLARHGTLAGFRSPVSGLYLGPEERCKAPSAEALARLMIARISSFAHPTPAS